jgi:outer membrane protein assembly factor BamB
VAYAVDAAGTLLAIWLADLTVEPLLPRDTADAVDREPARPGDPATLAAARSHGAASRSAAARSDDSDAGRRGTASQGDSVGLPLHVRLGPVRVGNRVLVATFDDRLICLDDQGHLAWNEPLPDGPLAGVPWPDGNVLICATVGGRVFQLAMDDGRLRGEVRDLGQPLGTGPVACHGRLVVAAYDGNLLQVDWP